MKLSERQDIRFFYMILGFLLSTANVQAQKMKVPSTMYYADMRLDLSSAAQKKIQTDVDALLRSEKYFQLKLDKIDAYFPLIEQVLKEEGVSDDIKYLVIQESALVGDAVSTANAIGYWQFKEEAAREVGLTINQAVDERMNIINATRGAARYFKSNNNYFNNWLYALMAYMTGPGGALKIADKSQHHQTQMRLDGDTHWYVLKFLAHKVAFEKFIGQNPHPKVQLFTYTKGSGKTLAAIAEEFALKEADLEPYNRWLKAKRVPDDKQYNVIIPDFSGEPNEELLAQATKTETVKERKESAKAVTREAQKHTEVSDTRRFPVIEPFKRKGAELKINGIPGVAAQKGDDIRALSQRASVSTSKFVTYNDLTSKQSEIIPGKAYYIHNKRNRGAAHYHIVEPGETLWSISQRFGLKLSKLTRDNRMQQEEPVKPGRVLWMRFIRPASFPIEYRDVPGTTIAPATIASSQPETQQAAPTPTKTEAPPEPVQVPEKTAKVAQPEPKTKVSSINKESYDSWEPGDRTEVPTSTTSDAAETIARKPANNTDDDAFEARDIVFADAESSSEEQPAYYEVQKGDTYYSIAKKYGLAVADIKKYNNLSESVSLSVGQKLRLKAPALSDQQQKAPQKKDDYIFHQVKSGETLYGIACAYDVTIKEIMNWNDKDTFDVALGEQLKIARK